MTEIPRPRGWPLLGHSMDFQHPQFMKRMKAENGPIFKVDLGILRPSKIFICSVDLLDDVCDESRFVKNPTEGPLFEVRNFAGGGLFTAFHQEESWGPAHRILMPALGPISIDKMFDDMHDIASQLVLKWVRAGSRTGLNAPHDFTNLTLDTLALCTMGTRFNSFYSEKAHPFVSAMTNCLVVSGSRARRPSFITNSVYRDQTQQYFQEIAFMRALAQEVIDTRYSRGTREDDFLDTLLYQTDPVSGKTLPNSTIIDNMVTFLIAGHETTSGLLSFLLYLFLKNPETWQKAREEIDVIVGQGPLAPKMLKSLSYLSACIREALRLYSPAPAFSVTTKSSNSQDYPILIGKERFIVNKGDTFTILLREVHRDPAVFGEDAEDFRPERMSEEEMGKLPKNAWKPFGNGSRGCIGREFALQETLIAMALILQNLEIEFQDPEYELKIQKSLTVKPKDFYIRVQPRDGLTLSGVRNRLHSEAPSAGIRSHAESPVRGSSTSSTSTPATSVDLDEDIQYKSLSRPLHIAYGSNTGTCQALAHSLARDGSSRGYRPKILSMNEAIGKIQPEAPTVFITSSYEGQAPDNAAEFVTWLQAQTESASLSWAKPFSGCAFAVFGCGNRDWHQTFQRIPALTESAISELGGSLLGTRGICDVRHKSVLDDFEQWTEQELWPALGTWSHSSTEISQSSIGLQTMTMDKTATQLSIDHFQSLSLSDLLPNPVLAKVTESIPLTPKGEHEKHHLSIRLPPGVTWNAGDYVSVLPTNDEGLVKAVMDRYGFDVSTQLVIKNDGQGSGNEDEEVSSSSVNVHRFLTEIMDLSHMATKRDMRRIAQSIADPEEGQKLERLLLETVPGEFQPTVVDILLAFPTANLPFSELVVMLGSLFPRQYSISSSPLADAEECSLTFGVWKGSTGSSRSNAIGKEQPGGVCSTYMAKLCPGDPIRLAIKPSQPCFGLPLLGDSPVLMICAGSGLAPFRGFLQERMLQIQEREKSLEEDVGKSYGKADLLIGCRHPQVDKLYGQELEGWAVRGATTLHYAFSQASHLSDGCAHVSDVLLKRKNLLDDVIGGNGVVLVCGMSSMMASITQVLVRTYADHHGVSLEEAEEWLEAIRNLRYVCDVFN